MIRNNKKWGEGIYTAQFTVILKALRTYFLPLCDTKSSVFSFVFERGNNYTKHYTRVDENWPACMFG